jgi:hypothetical protein
MKRKKEIYQKRNELFAYWMNVAGKGGHYANPDDPSFIYGAWSALGWLLDESTLLD